MEHGSGTIGKGPQNAPTSSAEAARGRSRSPSLGPGTSSDVGMLSSKSGSNVHHLGDVIYKSCTSYDRLIPHFASIF